MSQHRSLRATGGMSSKRSVLKRFERVELLKKRGLWKEGDRVVGLRMRRPTTRSPSFHKPRFLRSSTRSKRFNTLLLEDIPPVALKLRCCDIILPSLKKKAEPLSSAFGKNLAATYSRTSYTSTTIGNTAFDGRVRDGIGSDHSFITTKKPLRT